LVTQKINLILSVKLDLVGYSEAGGIN